MATATEDYFSLSLKSGFPFISSLLCREKSLELVLKSVRYRTEARLPVGWNLLDYSRLPQQGPDFRCATFFDLIQNK